MLSPLKTSPLLKIMSSLVVYFPAPTNLNFMWNFGSLLGMMLMIQILTGIFLAMHYVNDWALAFASLDNIMREMNLGWLMRMTHMNGASMYFICLYMHIGRSLYFNSYLLKQTWSIGVMITLISMLTAFLGYVLPWAQMSFWAATVITNMFSAIPLVGPEIVVWLWGSFAVGGATLTRFFTFHFLMPFILFSMMMIHLLYLHQTGSSNPLGLSNKMEMIPFNPYFTIKDIMGALLILMIMSMIVFMNPWILGDAENFVMANPMSTPPHIMPEWYFLFSYAILRAIPNKLGGVIALISSILILFTLPFTPKPKFKGNTFYFLNKTYFWSFISLIVMLEWIGACPIEYPYIILGQLFTTLYFSYFLTYFIIMKTWDKILS